ncbi:MAG: hypothetical protein O2816_13965 [Planctomycetota bacterium]|nr:hypothetical protein [Planctomycetota bacterium]
MRWLIIILVLAGAAYVSLSILQRRRLESEVRAALAHLDLEEQRAGLGHMAELDELDPAWRSTVAGRLRSVQLALVTGDAQEVLLGPQMDSLLDALRGPTWERVVRDGPYWDDASAWKETAREVGRLLLERTTWIAPESAQVLAVAAVVLDLGRTLSAGEDGHAVRVGLERGLLEWLAAALATGDHDRVAVARALRTRLQLSLEHGWRQSVLRTGLREALPLRQDAYMGLGSAELRRVLATLERALALLRGEAWHERGVLPDVRHHDGFVQGHLDALTGE